MTFLRNKMVILKSQIQCNQNGNGDYDVCSGTDIFL